jgi:hypothetical protein
MAVLGSCASLKGKREVVDNTLSSNYPKLKVKVDPSLTYLGDLRYDTGGYDVYDYRKTHHTQRAHSFVFLTAEESAIKKALVITIKKMKGTRIFTPDQAAHKKGILDQGNLRLAGKRFQYYSMVVKVTTEHPALEYVYDKGYTTPDYALRTTVVRVVKAGTMLIKLNYYEDITGSSFSYNSWRNKDDLYEEQLNCLEVCHKNCLTAFEILK